MFKQAIKWSGSKRSQADKIITYFPKDIDTYYEPSYECGLSNGLFDEKFIDSVREELSYEEFQREYM